MGSKIQVEKKTALQACELSRFAREMNKMLDSTSFSSEVIVAELNRQGFPLPLRTFNYWLQGYFLPRFDSAFALVSALENICGVTDNRLANALLHDLSSGAYFVPDDGSQSFVSNPSTVANYGNRQYLTLLNEKIDWSADLVRKALKDDVYVNEDFTQFRHRVTVLAVVPDVSNPSFSIKTVYEDGDRPIGDDYFYDIKGARLGKQDFYTEGDTLVCGVQLYLPENVVPGELHEISYAWDYVAPSPKLVTAERIFPWCLEFYSCTVTFEGGIPQDIKYMTYSSGEEETRSVSSDIPIVRDKNSVSIATKNFGHATGYFQYSTSGIGRE